MAPSGHQAEKCIEDIMRDYKGQYILAVEGNPPLGNDGTFCIPGGRPFVNRLKEVAADAAARKRVRAEIVALAVEALAVLNSELASA